MPLIQVAALVGSLAASVAAHGRVQGIVAGGVYYEGYNPSFQYADPAPEVIGWSDPEDLSNGFIPPSNYSGPDIICHLGATNAPISASVAAGDSVELQWTAWPSSHHGPVLTYLAKCADSCATVDKTTLEFFKIDEGGLINDTVVPGTWASDVLIANNNSWVVTIPTQVAPGNYVLRHEIIALHSAGTADGAQNYPQCINLEVTGTGTGAPSGTLGEALYQESGAGIIVDIYSSLSTYAIPGPTLWSDAVSASQTAVAINSDAPVSNGASTVYGATTTAAATSAAATSAAATSAAASLTAGNISSTAFPTAASTGNLSSIATTALTSATAAPANPSTAASVSSAVSDDTPTGTTTDIIYTTTLLTVTASVSPSVASIASNAASSIANLASAIPSQALTQTIPAAASSTATAGSGSGSGSGGNTTTPTTAGGRPAKPLPKGFTIADLLAWLEFMLRQLGRAERGGEGRSVGGHARDFGRRV